MKKAKSLVAVAKAVSEDKPYFIGISSEVQKEPLPSFQWDEQEEPVKFTALHDTHKSMGAKMVPFGLGYAGLVYVGGRGASGHAPGGGTVRRLAHGRVRGAQQTRPRSSIRSAPTTAVGCNPARALYSQFLTPDADVIDDTLVYRRDWDKFLVVVNASNDDKDHTWFESVRDGTVKIDNARPWARTYGYNAEIRDLQAEGGRICGWTSPCRDPGAATSCWLWEWTRRHVHR